jgi:sulfite reductase alpha subunit-like flavoprotein
MEKFKVTNGELLILAQNDLPEFLKQEAEPKTRYLLIELTKKVNSAIESYNKVNEEVIKKHTPEGKQGIERYKEGTSEFTEEFLSYIKDIEPVMKEEVEIEVKPIPESLIRGMKTKASEAFFKFVKWEE